MNYKLAMYVTPEDLNKMAHRILDEYGKSDGVKATYDDMCRLCWEGKVLGENPTKERIKDVAFGLMLGMNITKEKAKNLDSGTEGIQ